MKADLHNDLPRDARLDHNDPVWRLLGRVPMRQPDDWFAVRTVARCRHAGLSMEAGWSVVERIWRWALASGVGVSLAVAMLVPRMQSGPVVNNQQKNVQEAFEIVASLATDSDASSNTGASSWQDSSL